MIRSIVFILIIMMSLYPTVHASYDIAPTSNAAAYGQIGNYIGVAVGILAGCSTAPMVWLGQIPTILLYAFGGALIGTTTGIMIGTIVDGNQQKVLSSGTRTQ